MARTYTHPGQVDWKTNLTDMRATRRGGSTSARRATRSVTFAIWMISQHALCTTFGTTHGRLVSDPKIYVVQTDHQGHRTLHAHDHRPRRPGARPDLRQRHDRLRRRAVGPALDHHRHQPRWRSPWPASACSPPSTTTTSCNDPTRPAAVAGGFVYKTVPHITLKSIAQNQALDPIFATLGADPGREAGRPQRRARQRVTADTAHRAAGQAGREGEAARARAPSPTPTAGAGSLPEATAVAGWEVPFDTDPDWPRRCRTP